MSIKVLSASAGSGKTFKISMFYIDKVLKNPENFKKILAITFTNAAVNEMKDRILKKLYAISIGDKNVIYEYRNYLKNENLTCQYKDEEIIKRADIALKAIIYNYYHFSVYTIDSFLQKIFINCLIELDLRKNYKLIVETTNVIDEIIDDFLNFLEVETDVLNWIKDFVLHKIASKGKINLKNELIQLVQELNKEFYFFNKNNFENKALNLYTEIVNTTNKIQEEFIKQVNAVSEEFRIICNNNNISYENFKGGKNGIGNIIYNKFTEFKKGSKIDVIKTKTLNNFIENADWFSKSNNKCTTAQSELDKIHKKIKQLFETKAIKYETARVIEDNIYNIGLIHKIIHLLAVYKNESSILFLSDIAQQIKDFVSENYLFIYEKFGVKYEYILIDEFQDTSKLQYFVIKPLIDESLSTKGDETNVLIVGDVKQAIYRWRNGDWELMSKKLREDYKEQLLVFPLEYNWRSYPNIVNFNNLLIGQLIENENIKSVIENNYTDYFQKCACNNYADNFYGYVKVVINDDDNEEKDESWFINEVQRLVENNYRNIGILVRSNNDARKVFALLSQSDKFCSDLPIISKESITYSNSLLVEWIMYLVDYIYSESTISSYVVNELLRKLSKKNDREIQIFKESLIEKVEKKQPLSLYLMVEFIINETFDFIEINETEKIFAHNFLQMLNNFLAKNDNNEIAFIDWYFKEGRNKTIVLTSKSEGIFIETIHSSKGLEYEAVVIPYVNWPKKSHSEYLWIENNEIEKDKLPVVLVNSSKSLLETSFKEQFERNKMKNKVDDLNILYVALTRAKKVLIFKVYKSGIGKDLIDVFNNQSFFTKKIEINGKECEISKFKNENIIEIGELKTLQVETKKIEKDLLIWNKTNIFDVSLIVNLHEELNTNRNIAYGNLLHKILERISNIDMWEQAAEKVFCEYNVTENDEKEIKSKLEKILNEKTDIYKWYKNSLQIISEQFIVSDKKKYRPDKIFILKDKVILVEFKTGDTELEKYHYQIKKYSNLLSQMGYKNIEAYLYNLDKNLIEKV